MNLELFALCDASADYAGRLNIMGIFETIAAPQAPIMRERCCVVTRLRFQPHEEGEHMATVRIANLDGKLIVPEMKAPFVVQLPPKRDTVAANLNLNIAGLTFPDFGEHTVTLSLDGQYVTSIPLTVVQATPPRRGPMEN